MCKTSWPKSVSHLTNMPKNTKPTMGLVRHCLQYYAQMGIGFESSHPVISSLFRILTIFLIYKCYGNISEKTTIAFAFKMLKQILLHTCSIPCIFIIIAFAIAPYKLELISCFLYILFTATLTSGKINKTVIITVGFMVYLETYVCCSARKCVSFLNVEAKFTP